MKVYVLEKGDYSDRYVVGVYTMPERAMAAQPDEEWEVWEPLPGADYPGRKPTWLSKSAEITEYELDGAEEAKS